MAARRLRPPFADKRLFVLDMDGTIYLGSDLFPWTQPFLAAVRKAGARYLFLTNNSSRTSRTYVEKLRRLGIEAGPENVLTSGDATLELLRREGRYRRLCMLATPEVAAEFEAAGFVLDDDAPEALVLTFDMTLSYDRLVRFCHHVRAGLPYLATHPDINCPTPDGPIPDAGAFMDLIAASTGRRPDRIVGKPEPGILQAAMARFGMAAEETVMIGDRLYTDVACALAAGATGVLVLSGESTREMAAESPHRPHFIMEDLASLLA